MQRQLWILGLFLCVGCGDASDPEERGSADASSASIEGSDAGFASPDGSSRAPEGDTRTRANAGRGGDARADADGSSPGDAAARDAATSKGNGGEAEDGQPGDGDAALPGFRLVFQDEFDGPAGALPSDARWTFETGGHGFGNNQLEFNTARPENASLDGQGKLVVTARKEVYMGNQYTSARLKAQGKFERAYGRYEARMRLPRGQGLWPAFWMLGSDIERVSWPACGEIDIMENIGREPARIHGTLHVPGLLGRRWHRHVARPSRRRGVRR